MVMAVERNASIVKKAYCFINITVWEMLTISARKSVGKPLFGRPARDGRKTLW
jgi:hypothetical protein